MVMATSPARPAACISAMARVRRSISVVNLALIPTNDLPGADGEGGDGQALDHLVGVGPQDGPVLERGRLALGRVAHHVAVGARLVADAGPLAAGGEPAAAPSPQPGHADLVDGELGAQPAGGVEPTAAAEGLPPVHRGDRLGRQQVALHHVAGSHGGNVPSGGMTRTRRRIADGRHDGGGGRARGLPACGGGGGSDDSGGGGLSASAEDRRRMPSCGAYEAVPGELPPRPRPSATASSPPIGAGREAELAITVASIEGDPITTIYRVLGPNDVELFVDASADQFARGEDVPAALHVGRRGRPRPGRRRLRHHRLTAVERLRTSHATDAGTGRRAVSRPGPPRRPGPGRRPCRGRRSCRR